MKFGLRTPSIKKSISASTKGQLTRTIKSATNPLYRQKGMGWINDPQKALYNNIYNKTTVDICDFAESPNLQSYAQNNKNIKIQYETKNELRKNVENIILTLNEFNAPSKMLMVEQGATMTTYYIQPQSGIRISDIVQIKDYLALYLGVPTVNIIPCPQKGAIGIEVANRIIKSKKCSSSISDTAITKSRNPYYDEFWEPHRWHITGGLFGICILLVIIGYICIQIL